MFFKRDQQSKQLRLQAAAPANGQSLLNHQVEPTYIANDIKIEGDIHCNGELHIDGTLNGHLRAEICVIDANAAVRGHIEANSVYIYGKVEGPIVANHVQIYAGAVVRSDIFHRTIAIENGADVLGNFLRQDQNQRATTQSAAYSPTKQNFAPPIAVRNPTVTPEYNGAETDFFTQVLGENAVINSEQSNQSPIGVIRPKVAQKR